MSNIDYSCAVCDVTGIKVWIFPILVVLSIACFFYLIKYLLKYEHSQPEPTRESIEDSSTNIEKTN